MSTHIGQNPPNDGRDWDCQCARCGSSMGGEQCGACGGEGITGPGELYEQDPLWYDQDDYERCDHCNGEGGWVFCLSDYNWCITHPLPGRIEIPRDMPEWFTMEKESA